MSGIWTTSKCFSECQIDASGADQRMLPILQRRDAVIDEPRGTAPHNGVTTPKGQEGRTGSERRWPPHKNTAGNGRSVNRRRHSSWSLVKPRASLRRPHPGSRSSCDLPELPRPSGRSPSTQPPPCFLNREDRRRRLCSKRIRSPSDRGTG